MKSACARYLTCRTNAAAQRDDAQSKGSGRIRYARVFLALILLSTGAIALAPSSALADAASARYEQYRYAVETLNLPYSQYVVRQVDFRASGCTTGSDGCLKPSPYNRFDWTDDGCSGADQIGPVSNAYRNLFNQPCRLHDFGYRNFGKGLSLYKNESMRQTVDNRLKAEMVRLCDDKYPGLKKYANWAACQAEADVIYAAVRRLSNWGTTGTPPLPPDNCPGGDFSGSSTDGTCGNPPPVQVALPTQPADPHVTSTTSSGAVLAWTDASNNESEFVTQYKVGGGGWVTGPSVGAGATSVSIGGLGASTAYTFQVGAHNAAGTHWSAYAYGTTTAASAPPLNYQVTNYDNDGTTGVYLRNSSNINDVIRDAGHFVSYGTTVTLICGGLGSAVGPYSNTAWDYVRVSDGRTGWISEHWLNTPVGTNQHVAGEPNC